jgi:hypothetical protein
MSDSITYEDVMKACAEIEKHAPKNTMRNPFEFNIPFHFNGMPIYEVHDKVVPKIQISESFADKWLTDEAKEKLNAKLVDMLGTRTVRPIPEGQMFMIGNALVARPEHIALLSVLTTA